MIPDFSPEKQNLLDQRNYGELLRISQHNLKQDPEDGEAAYWSIVCFFETNQKDKAIKMGNEMIQQVTNNTWKGRLYNRVGSFYWRTGELKAAQEYYNRGIGIMRDHGTTRDLASIFNNLGVIFDTKGKLDEALVLYEKAVNLIDKHKYEGLYGSFLVNTGIIYYLKYENNKAEKTFLEALGIFQRNNRKGGVLVVSHQLLLLYIRSERKNEAKEVYQQITAIAQDRNDNFTQSVYQLSKAIMLKSSGRLREFVEAMKILADITENSSYEYEHKLTALINLTELKLDELKLMTNSHIIDEIKEFINKIHVYAEKNQSFPLLVDTKLLKTRLYIVRGEFNNARKMLDSTFDYVTSNNLEHLINKVRHEENYLNTHLANINTTLGQNKVELEKMELNSIEEYLKSVKSLLK